jgi:hypothetical protein
VLSSGKMVFASRIFRQFVPRSPPPVCETSRGPLLFRPLTIRLPVHHCLASLPPPTCKYTSMRGSQPRLLE